MHLRRVLITGGQGQLGSDLTAVLAGRADEVAAPSHAELDITDDGAVLAAFERVQPDTVLNCAAFHNVDLCESEEDRAFEVNARAVKRLAERCAQSSARLVHLSTNYVFDGTAAAPYGETDIPNPLSAYGISKLAGEHAARSYAPGALVVRTAGLYGMGGNASKGGNFVMRLLDRARERESVQMVSDQRASPTYTADLAPALVEAVEAGVEGILHLTSAGECSWLEFSQRVLSLAGVKASIEPVETRRRAGVAPRPLNGVLSSRAGALGLTQPRSWQEALPAYMEMAGLVTGGG